MGAINYGSNDYFNIGMDLSPDYDEFDHECEFNYQIEETQRTLDKYNFEYFTIKIEYGYYQGFYIDIDFNYCYVDYWEKPLILKECTQLKKLLLELSYNGLVKYSAGWCIGYYSEQETNKAIKEAIKEIKEKMRKFPVYKTYMEQWKKQHA